MQTPTSRSIALICMYSRCRLARSFSVVSVLCTASCWCPSGAFNIQNRSLSFLIRSPNSTLLSTKNRSAPFNRCINSMASTGSTSLSLTWENGRDEALAKCVLPMSKTSHKGSSGRVGVLGGSARYTGAPYYAAMASLKVGADLAYVFCAEEAAMPIKCYSPELMVSPVYCAADFDLLAPNLDSNESSNEEKEETRRLIGSMVDEVVSMMDRMHVLVIGPGLGRCPMVMQATADIIEIAKSKNLAMVLDADALFLLTLEPFRKLLVGYDNAILTPNVMEYRRLVQAKVLPSENDTGTFQHGAAIVVKKGQTDVVTQFNYDSSMPMRQLECIEEGGLKRSGGLGDILSGTLGTFVAWNQILRDRQEPNDMALSCWAACNVVKRATKCAFSEKHRAMTAPDVLSVIGPTFHEMTT